MNWKRPLGLVPLLSTLLTLFLLSAMLASMVANRIALLENGTEIVLKTAPIDPRDLLRGYFVRLRYDISRIKDDDLETPLSDIKMAGGFKRHSPIFVKLRPDRDGYWSPVSLHRKHPENDSTEDRKPTSIFIRGKVIYGRCTPRVRALNGCRISIRYGIEKFFTQKSRAKKLEDFGRQTTPELKELAKQIKDLQKQYRQAIKNRRQQSLAVNKVQTYKSIRTKPAIKRMSDHLNKLRKKQRQLATANREEMTKRFAIIVRVDKESGEAAISGLQLDGKRIYEERLL